MSTNNKRKITNGLSYRMVTPTAARQLNFETPTKEIGKSLDDTIDLTGKPTSSKPTSVWNRTPHSRFDVHSNAGDDNNAEPVVKKVKTNPCASNLLAGGDLEKQLQITVTGPDAKGYGRAIVKTLSGEWPRLKVTRTPCWEAAAFKEGMEMTTNLKYVQQDLLELHRGFERLVENRILDAMGLNDDGILPCKSPVNWEKYRLRLNFPEYKGHPTFTLYDCTGIQPRKVNDAKGVIDNSELDGTYSWSNIWFHPDTMRWGYTNRVVCMRVFPPKEDVEEVVSHQGSTNIRYEFED